MMSNCPCGSGAAYEDCCGPIHQGNSAPTAEKLMRARYSAFEKQELQFLENSLSSESKKDYDAAANKEWAESATWKKLTIVNTENGGADDQEGMVEFSAQFDVKGKAQIHHERSFFIRENGNWVYDRGVLGPSTEPVRVEKIGRNDPCTCGSGKKYKKCCGR